MAYVNAATIIDREFLPLKTFTIHTISTLLIKKPKQ